MSVFIHPSIYLCSNIFFERVGEGLRREGEENEYCGRERERESGRAVAADTRGRRGEQALVAAGVTHCGVCVCVFNLQNRENGLCCEF